MIENFYVISILYSGFPAKTMDFPALWWIFQQNLLFYTSYPEGSSLVGVGVVRLFCLYGWNGSFAGGSRRPLRPPRPLTGWIVHPSDGSCHAITKEELKAEIEKQFDKKQER
jgi:hypothetical protein